MNKEYFDPAYPNVAWKIYDGPFYDEDGSEYYFLTGSNGAEGEGYFKGDGVEMINVEYYGEPESISYEAAANFDEQSTNESQKL